MDGERCLTGMVEGNRSEVAPRPLIYVITYESRYSISDENSWPFGRSGQKQVGI